MNTRGRCVDSQVQTCHAGGTIGVWLSVPHGANLVGESDMCTASCSKSPALPYVYCSTTQEDRCLPIHSGACGKCPDLAPKPICLSPTSPIAARSTSRLPVRFYGV